MSESGRCGRDEASVGDEVVAARALGLSSYRELETDSRRWAEKIWRWKQLFC